MAVAPCSVLEKSQGVPCQDSDRPFAEAVVAGYPPVRKEPAVADLEKDLLDKLLWDGSFTEAAGSAVCSMAGFLPINRISLPAQSSKEIKHLKLYAYASRLSLEVPSQAHQKVCENLFFS